MATVSSLRSQILYFPCLDIFTIFGSILLWINCHLGYMKMLEKIKKKKKKKNREKTKQHKCPFSEILKLWILQIPFRQSELELMILFYN